MANCYSHLTMQRTPKGKKTESKSFKRKISYSVLVANTLRNYLPHDLSDWQLLCIVLICFYSLARISADI